MEILSIIIGLFIILILSILIYFRFANLLANYYSKKGLERKMWLINLGLVLIFGIIIAAIIYFDAQLKQSFISQNIWLYPLMIFGCVFTIIILNLYIEKKIKD